MPGHTEEEINRHIEALKQPLPNEVRAVYRMFSGCPFESMINEYQQGKRTSCETATDTLLQELTDSEWAWGEPELHGIEDWDPSWAHCRFFGFAQTTDGSRIVYCPNPPDRQAGTILLLDHECANEKRSPVNDKWSTSIVLLADSLAAWLVRWALFGFEEPGKWAEAVSGDEESTLYQDFLADHLRLNPGLEWPQKYLR